MPGFNDVNRYSYSGADARAYAFYPVILDPNAPGTIQAVTEIEEKIDAVVKRYPEADLNDPDNPLTKELAKEIKPLYDEIQLLEKQSSIAPIHLESLATVSFQVHEPKAPARALGYRAPKGFARSVRTIAGTMIFIVVEDHPLSKLAKLEMSKFKSSDTSYSLDQDTFGRGSYAGYGSGPQNTNIAISTMLKPFNMLVQYSTEVPVNQTVGGTASMAPIASYMLEGIEIISEGITTSVNDMVTEVVIQFQAHNVYQMTISHSEQVLNEEVSAFTNTDEYEKINDYVNREILRARLENFKQGQDLINTLNSIE